MKIIERPSPNFDERSRSVDAVILHYTGMKTGEEALERLCDKAAGVSAHYVVEEDGRVFQLVAEDKRAFHAGISSWRGEGEINARSIGVEIVNPGHEWGYRDFPKAQIDSVVALLKMVCTRHNIPAERVLGHSDVAPLRKEDPGERFPWKRLAAEGLAPPPYVGVPDPSLSYEDAILLLRRIGYEVPDVAPGRPGPAAALLAFQRRFCPEALAQGFNPLTKAALRHTARLVE
jgi:N-acetylmuramoyl-L-alanine amidase